MKPKIPARLRGVFERPKDSNTWWIRYADAEGRIRREKAGTKAQAKNLYQIRKAEALQGKKMPQSLRARAVTFSDLAKDALEYSRIHKRSAADDEERMVLLLKWFGEFSADAITPQQIERKLKAAAAERMWANATVNRYKALISLVYRIGIDNGRVQTNPARRVRRLREENGVVRFLSQEEEARLRAVVEPMHPERWAAIAFALNTGLRASEQFKLRWDDIRGNPQQVCLRETKNGSARHVPLNQPALKALEYLRRLGDTHSLLIFPQQHYRVWFERALKAARIEGFTWHCLRHTFASRLVMTETDIRTVAELMGHRSLQMTMRYAHLAPEHTSAAVERLENFGKPTGTKTSTDPNPALPMNVLQFPQVIYNIEGSTHSRALSSAVRAADS